MGGIGWGRGRGRGRRYVCEHMDGQANENV